MRIAFCIALLVITSNIHAAAQSLPGDRPEEVNSPSPSARNAPAGKRPIVAEVKIVGADGAPLQKVRTSLKTRPNREYDPLLVESDVRTLLQSGYFYSAIPKIVDTRDGMYVKFEVREKPLIREVILIGNRAFSDKVLLKDLGFKVGDAIDPFTVNEGKRRLEERYHTKGFPKTTVTIDEGLSTKDRRVVYHINEGPLERIGSVSFVGNDPNLVSDGRLKSQIESKPGWFYYLGGKVDMQKIEADKEKLILYYRSLGYFDAKVDTMYEYDDGNKWMRLTFVINEGVRFVVREILVQGNERFSDDDLHSKMLSQAGQYFNQGKADADTQIMLDRYGEVGYQFADIQPNIIYSEEPGELSLVYNIREGKPVHIDEIKIKIDGENPRTNETVVLNRLMVHPGELLNRRKLNIGLARLKASTIFNTDPSMGAIPEANVLQPELQDMEKYMPREPEEVDSPNRTASRASNSRR
jgi:outer membrane protein insertion porin family